MSQISTTSDIFTDFRQFLNADQELREDIRVKVRDLEQTARDILTILQAVHQPEGIKECSAICEKAKSKFDIIRTQLTALIAVIPQGQYYRFHDHWRFLLQRLVFLVAFIEYLETETLVTRESISEVLAIHVVRDDGFHIDLEDFLMGLLQMSSELSRLAINAVTAEDFSRPMRIAKFVGELDSGFRLLNLKNDSLRKRFDALKYDVKKIEEVVYDLTIRGLKPKTEVKETKE
ncbi:unnamed protein product [Owenia fusiformis]|uniref:Translin n=1 Tax=Owenia fusiformis TaxID=6347 RepID=A0A8J1TSH5_OWEFU|nr:unnamed protein product [Owenia fusiformis]